MNLILTMVIVYFMINFVAVIYEVVSDFKGIMNVFKDLFNESEISDILNDNPRAIRLAYGILVALGILVTVVIWAPAKFIQMKKSMTL